MEFRRKGRKSKAAPPTSESTSLRIKFRGKDDAPLTMQELREALLDAARQLKQYESGYRAKYPTLYLMMIDQDGQPVRVNDANEIIIYPYKTAAEEHGI